MTRTRVRADQLRDGDTVYVTGRWQTLSNMHAEPSGAIRARTDRGGELFISRPGAVFDVATG